MQIKASVIRVNSTADSTLVVRDHILGVDKAGFILVDVHARLHELPVIRDIHHIDVPLIVDLRDNDAHIHAAQRRVCQILAHALVQNKVGRSDIDVIPRLVDHSGVRALRGIVRIPVGPAHKGLHIPLLEHMNIRFVIHIIDHDVLV